MTWLPWLPVLLVLAFSDAPVTIDVFPRVSNAPTTVRALVIVPRDSRSRRICYGYTSDTAEARNTCIDLHGADAKRSYLTYWSIRTGGEYEAVAVLTRMEDGRERTYTDRRPFTVIGLDF